MYYLKRDNARDFSIKQCTGYDSSAPLAAHKARASDSRVRTHNVRGRRRGRQRGICCVSSLILRRFISAFLFATFGRAYARRRFTKWHLVGDSVGLQD